MKKIYNDMMGFTKANVGIGIGGAIVGAAGGNAVGVGTAMTSMGSMMPIVGTTMMGGHTMRLVNKLNPKRRKRRY